MYRNTYLSYHTIQSSKTVRIVQLYIDPTPQCCTIAQLLKLLNVDSISELSAKSVVCVLAGVLLYYRSLWSANLTKTIFAPLGAGGAIRPLRPGEY